MMRLFKRRSSDPNPQLESLSALSENDGSNKLKSGSRVPSSENVETQKSSLTTWGKAWEKIKRQDSSENLPHKSKKRHWSPLKSGGKNTESCSRDVSCENLTNLNIFTSEDSEKLKISDEDVRKVYDMYKNIDNGATIRDRQLRNSIRSKRNIKCVSDNIELSQQQLLDYLMLMKPSSNELENIFGNEKCEDDRKSPKLGSLSEEKKSRRSKIKSMFMKRSSSKSDDESDVTFKKINQKSSSTDSLTSILNFILPKKRHASKSPTMGTRFKSDESGYGSDSTKAATIDSPVGSVKSQISQTSHEVDDEGEINKTLDEKDMGAHRGRHDYSDDTDTADEDMETTYTFSKFYGRSPTKSYNKKRTRSQSRDDELNQNALKRRSVRLKKSPSIKEKIKMSTEDLTETCYESLQSLKISGSNKYVDVSEKQRSGKIGSGNLKTLDSEEREIQKGSVLDKEFKCVRLKIKQSEMIGVKISPQAGKNTNNNDNCSYIISEILPNSVASRNENLKVDDEVIKVNGIRIKGLPYTTVKAHFAPRNNELELVISRTICNIKPPSKASKKRTNSFKTFLSRPTTLLSPKKENLTSKKTTYPSILTPSPKKLLYPSILKSPSVNSFSSVTSPTKFTSYKNDNRDRGFNPLEKSQSAANPTKKFVGLSDILNGNSDTETKVTFSEKTPKETCKKISDSKINRELVRGKPPLYLKGDEKDVFKSPPPVKKVINSEHKNISLHLERNRTKFGDIAQNALLSSPKLNSRRPHSIGLLPTSPLLRSPSLRLNKNHLKVSSSSPISSSSPSPSPHGMRKFSISSSSHPQISKNISIPTKTGTVSPKMCYKTVTFFKGPGCKSLGFSIVGGTDSPKGSIGIYVKTIFKDGQASDNQTLQKGDELLSINGTSFLGLTHSEAVNLFKSIKCGEVLMEVASRHPFRMHSHSL